MHENVEKLLAETSRSTLEKVARGALGDDSATLVGEPEWLPVGGWHADSSTLAVKRITGRATSAGKVRAWSSVVKVIELGHDIGVRWLSPSDEIHFYETKLFTDSSALFRAASCYRVEKTSDVLTILWLEDLSEAPQPPWSREHYVMASRGLGQFHGRALKLDVDLSWVRTESIFAGRWDSWNFPLAVKTMREKPEASEFKRAFAGDRLNFVLKYYEALPALWERVGQCPTVLSHGDCHARNLFPLNGSTVAVDWSGIGMEPIGSDFGNLVGAGTSWRNEERLAVVGAMPELFDAYLDGLQSEGWEGDSQIVRLGMFGQLAGYMGVSLHNPAKVINGFEARRIPLFEGRTGVKIEELPEATAVFFDAAEPLLHEVVELSGIG